MKEVRNFLEQVLTNTGIKVYLESDNLTAPFTAFEIELSKNKYGVKIQGETQVEQNYARLIQALALSYRPSKQMGREEFLSAVLTGELEQSEVQAYLK